MVLPILLALALACGDDGNGSVTENTTDTTDNTASTGSSSSGSSSGTSSSTGGSTGDAAAACAAASDAAACDAANEGKDAMDDRCQWLALSRLTDACTIEAVGEECLLTNADEGGPGCAPSYRDNPDMSRDFFAPQDCLQVVNPGLETCFQNEPLATECSCF